MDVAFSVRRCFLFFKAKLTTIFYRVGLPNPSLDRIADAPRPALDALNTRTASYARSTISSQCGLAFAIYAILFTNQYTVAIEPLVIAIDFD